MEKKRDIEVLILGARPGSIGEAVEHYLDEEGETVFGWPTYVTTAGLGQEDIKMACNPFNMAALFDQPWDHVICTIGANEETDANVGVFLYRDSLMTMMDANFITPMMAYWHWLDRRPEWRDNAIAKHGHFVFLSSNSAEVPRSKSLGYCAAKAALSQGVRCLARSAPQDVCVYAYEPGWVEDTPMSEEVAIRLPIGVDKMRGGAPMDVQDLGAIIGFNLGFIKPRVLNGMTIRLDGGER